MKKYAIILTALLALLLVASPALANDQGFETIDCTTKALKDSFSTSENVCIKETSTDQPKSCADPNEIITAYVLNYRTNYNTPDGSYFYTAYRSLTPIVKTQNVQTNNDRSLFANLGIFPAGSYDVAQGSSGIYYGGCLDELGSPLVSAGFDVVDLSPPSCTPSWQLGRYNNQSCWYDSNSCNVTTGKPTDAPLCKDLSGQWCTPNWVCNEWSACTNSTQTRNCNDVNNCGISLSKPNTTQSCEVSQRCLDVLTPAYNPDTEKCKIFQTSCIDDGWVVGACPYSNTTFGNNASKGENKTQPPVSGCTENWACEEWSGCINGAQTRDCNDANICGTALKKPILTRTCEIKITDDNKTIIINPPPGVKGVLPNLWLIIFLVLLIIVLIVVLVFLVVHITSSK